MDEQTVAPGHEYWNSPGQLRHETGLRAIRRTPSIDAQRQHCVDNHQHTGKVEATYRYRFACTPVCDRPECREVAHSWVQSMVGRRGTFVRREDGSGKGTR